MSRSKEPISVLLGDGEAIIHIEDYLNKLSGERIEKVCLQFLNEGYRRLILDFRKTELVNSIGISFLLGIIDTCERQCAELVFINVSEDVLNLFETLGITKKVKIDFASIE